jgi:hypothetical protein
MKRCPSCGIEHDDAVETCDCGFDLFSNKQTDASIANKFKRCPHCGDINNTIDDVVCKSCGKSLWTKQSYVSFRMIAFVVLLVSGIFATGKLHLVIGGNIGIRVLPKIAFSFSETVINLDVIGGLPYIVAISKYPLSVRALERSGIVESLEERQRKVQNEIMNEYNKILKQLNQ